MQIKIKHNEKVIFMQNYTEDYLLDKRVKIFQPIDGYRASTDAVLLSSLVKNVKAGDKILDVGSGTGAVSLCIANRFQQKSPLITGLELQPELAELSNKSAEANGFQDFLHYHVRDIHNKDNFPQPCSFQHVITNPPYTDHDMPSPNQSKALAHNHKAFSLTEWLYFCLKMLAPQGMFYMVNRVEALNETLLAFAGKAGAIQIIPLFTKPEQNAKRILLIAKKDSKAPTQILPPLIIHENNGYTPQAHKILRLGCGFFD